MITICIDFHMSAEGAVSSAGVRMSSRSWDPVKPALVPEKTLPGMFQFNCS